MVGRVASLLLTTHAIDGRRSKLRDTGSTGGRAAGFNGEGSVVKAKRWLILFLASALALTGVVQGIPHLTAVAAASSGGFHDPPAQTITNPRIDPASVRPPASAPRKIPRNHGPGEVTSLRTRTSRTSITRENTLQTTISTGSINYQDSSGAWQPIDDTLIAAGSSFHNAANAYSVSLPATLATGPVSISQAGESVSFTLTGAVGSAAVSGNTATYAGALPGVDLAYAAQNDALKETLTLASAAAPASYSFTLQLSPGLSARTGRHGAIAIVNGPGATVFSLPAPFMYDATGQASLSTAVGMSVAGSTLTVIPDPAWIHSPSRHFPVVIDPSVQTFGADQNCYIAQGSPTSSFCSQTSLNVGWDGNAQRSLLQFNIQNNAFPNYSTVLNAELGVYFSSGNGIATSVGMYSVEKSWTTGATWNTADGSNAWSCPSGAPTGCTAGAGGAYDTGPVLTNTVGSAGGWVKWYPTQMAQEWLDGSTMDSASAGGEATVNAGVMLKAVENVNEILYFLSSRNGNASLNPYITITYEPRFGEQNSFKQVVTSLDDRMKVEYNVGTGNVIVKADDLHISGTGLDLDIVRYSNGASYNVFYMGDGWSLGTSRDKQLRIYTQSVALQTQGTADYTFIQNGSSFTSPPEVDATLSQSIDSFCPSGTAYELTYHKSNERNCFSIPSGQPGIALLSRDIDVNNHQLNFTYNSNLTPATITDTQGRVTSFTEDPSSGYITKITDPSGRTVQYGYTGATLTSSIDPAGNTTRYSYGNADDDLTQVVDPNGNITNFVFNSGDRLASMTRIDGTKQYTTSYGYTYDTGAASGTVTVTDADSHTTTYTIDHKSRVSKVTDAKGNPASTSYSPDSQVQTYLDYGNNTTTYGFNPAGGEDVSSIQASSGNSASFQYGNTNFPHYPSSYKDPQGNSTNYAYDPSGNLNQESLPSGKTVNAVYTNASGVPNGLLAGATDAKGALSCTVPNVTPSQSATNCFTYDISGNLTSATYPSPLGTVHYTYDPLSRLHTKQDGKGQYTTYCYDNLDRVLSITSGNFNCPVATPDISKVYDGDGNLTQLSDSSGTTGYAYDTRNHLIQKTFPGNTAASWTYDAVGNLLTETNGDGTVNYSYDQDNLLSQVQEPTTGQLITFSYDKNGNRLTTTYPTGTNHNSTVVTQQFDAANRLTSMAATTNGAAISTATSLTYGYKNGSGADSALRTSMTDGAGVKTTYTYDLLNRLVEAKASNGSSDYQYSYDANGNRCRNDLLGCQGGSDPYQYNAANELTTFSGRTYSYDAEGNQTSDGGAVTFGYNTKNQTTSESGASQAYRGYGQSERLSYGNYSFRDGLLGTYGSTYSSATTYYVRDNRGGLLEWTSQGTRYFYIVDALGSVIAMVDVNGTLARSYTYGPYGNITSQSGTVQNLWTYTGKLAQTDTSIYKIGQRYYDANTGRWTQRDPKDGSYLYSGDCPSTFDDPTGLGTGTNTGACGSASLSIDANNNYLLQLRSSRGPILFFAGEVEGNGLFGGLFSGLVFGGSGTATAFAAGGLLSLGLGGSGAIASGYAETAGGLCYFYVEAPQ